MPIELIAVQERIEQFIESAKLKAKNGLTWEELGELFDELKLLAVRLLMEVTLAGAEKKAYVMQTLEYFLDQTLPYIPLPIWLQPFGPWLIVPIVKKVALVLADGSIEAIYAMFKTEE